MTDTDTVTAKSRPARSQGIKIHGPEGFEGMRRAGKLAAECLDMLIPHVVPGVVTDHLDTLAREFILDNGSTGEKATFNVSMTFTTKLDAQTRLRAKLDGTIDVRPKDSEVTAVSLKGPLTILDAGGNEKGTGDMTFSGSESAK